MLLVLPGLKLKNDLLLIVFPSAPLAQNPMLSARALNAIFKKLILSRRHFKDLNWLEKSRALNKC